jgi:hypothetical protein
VGKKQNLSTQVCLSILGGMIRKSVKAVNIKTIFAVKIMKGYNLSGLRVVPWFKRKGAFETAPLQKL